MRYGKVYFYDRMGNRKPTESDRVREALENFDAPRFEPPFSDETFHIRGRRNSIPLQSPRIPSDSNYILPRFSPGPDNEFPDSGVKYNLDRSDLLSSDRVAVNRTRASDLEKPKDFNPIDSSHLKEDLQTAIDEGIVRGYCNKEPRWEDFRKGDLHQYEQKERRVFSDDTYSIHELCSQCRLEEEHLKTWKREADELKEKHRKMSERAAIYESDMKQREEDAERERQMNAKRLVIQIEQTNKRIMEETRRRNIKSPPNDHYIFKDRSEMTDEEVKARKELGDRILLDQIEEKKQREWDSAQKELMLDSLRNEKAAEEYAKVRDFDLLRVQQDREKWRKQLELQMELQKTAPPTDNNWLWWAERPDEHGWRNARLTLKNDQVERNVLLKDSGERLQQFIRKQEVADIRQRASKKEHYAKLREKLHANSNLIFGNNIDQPTSQRPIIVQPNIQVENAWRNAHEQNEKKYRILQESTERTEGALEKKLEAMSSCARCARCTRPLRQAKAFVLSKEKIY